jgi:hypothetical protein
MMYKWEGAYMSRRSKKSANRVNSKDDDGGRMLQYPGLCNCFRNVQPRLNPQSVWGSPGRDQGAFPGTDQEQLCNGIEHPCVRVLLFSHGCTCPGRWQALNQGFLAMQQEVCRRFVCR